VTVSKIASEKNVFDVVDFEKCNISDTPDTISGTYDLTLHPSESTLTSVKSENGNKILELSSADSDNSYISKNAKVTDGVHMLSFDVTPKTLGAIVTIEPRTTSNSYGDRSYYFTNGNKTLSVISGGYNLGSSNEYIIPGRTYHISFLLDIKSANYILYAEDDFNLEKTVLRAKITSNSNAFRKRQQPHLQALSRLRRPHQQIPCA